MGGADAAMRSLIFAALLLACGGREASAPEPEPAIDRSPGVRPEGTLIEVAIDGGDEALAELVARLPPIAERAALPSRVRTLLDGLLDAPPELVSHVASDSPLRLVMAQVDGQTRSAVAVRLDERRERAGGDGPRGASRIGDRAAVDADLAVISDDPAMLDRSFAYLAYTAMAAEHEAGIVISVPHRTLAGPLRTALERQLDDLRARAMGSIAAARASHDRPPDLGDPEALVTSLADAMRARIAYLPDLGEATITLRAAASGLALVATSEVTASSPLAVAIEDAPTLPRALASSPPASSALVIASGLSSPGAVDLVDALASVAGTRLASSERGALDDLAQGVAAIGGRTHALAIGEAAGGPFALALTPEGRDAALPTPWGRAFPWTSALLSALVGCTPATTHATSGDRTLCGDVVIATRADANVRADAVGRGASELASTTRDRFVRGDRAESPDLARDLSALEGSTFAVAIVRPLRALPLLALVSDADVAGLPRGDGAIVLAIARDGARLRVDLRASTAAFADLAAVTSLFAEE